MKRACFSTTNKSRVIRDEFNATFKISNLRMKGKVFVKNSLLIKLSLITTITLIISIGQVQSQIFIEAENYINMSGVQTEGTSDDGGGINVGFIDNNDWMEYKVNIPVTGEYKLSFRAAGEIGGKIKVKNDGVEIQTVTIAATGGWQMWKTTNAEASINFDAGEHTIRLTASPGGFNLNWLKIILSSPLDTDAPTAPIISENKVSVHDVFLSWNASTDAGSSVIGYQILKDDKFYRYTTDTFLNISKLPHNQSFALSVVASDLAGNNSTASSINVTTDTLPWALSWGDEFNYTGDVDRTKWNFQTGGDGWGNGEAQYYTDGENATVADGVLTIEARKENHGTNKFTSTRMNSSGKGDFLYGRIEVKAKLPKTGGTWPAIWTLPTEWVYGPWPDCGEVDIMEHTGNSYGHVFGTIHTAAYNHVDGTQKSGGTNFTDVSNTFHTYALEWYPDHLDWYYDDVIVFTFENEYKTAAEWPFDIPHHLLLNMAIGGGLGGTINTAGQWPQQMVVDYVRVYDFKLGENDTIAPEPPTNLVADAKWSSINLSWSPSKDNNAIDKYYVFVDGEKIDSVTGLSVLIQNLEPLTEYALGVQAIDLSGNLSTQVSTTLSTIEISGIEIPGKIEAENFTSMLGVDTEDCTDAGGGKNVGWIDANDWLTYTIDVSATAEYRANFRLASEGASGTINLLNENGIELTHINSPITGGWQKWKSVLSEPFSLAAGIQNLKLATSTGGFNMNWIEIKGKDDFVGIRSANNETVFVYPNPLMGTLLYAVLPLENENIKVLVIAADGRVLVNRMEKAQNGRLEIRDIDLKSGVYFISFVTDNKVFTQTLAVQ